MISRVEPVPCSLADRKSLGVAAPHSTHNWTTTCGLPEENTTDYLTASRAVSQLTEIGQGSAPFFFAVGFHKPHPHWPIPRYLQDRYKDLPLTTSKLAPVGMP